MVLMAFLSASSYSARLPEMDHDDKEETLKNNRGQNIPYKIDISAHGSNV